jgi:hypothetical protein
MKLSATNQSQARPGKGPVQLACLLLFSISMSFPAAAQSGSGGENTSATSATGAVKAPKAAETVPVDPAATVQGLGPFGRMLPLGQRNLAVKIPSFRDGTPNSLIRAGSMTRLDEDNMYIEKLDIRMYGATPERDLRVLLKTGTYHMPSQILSSEERSRITRQDFQMDGDSMVFDTATRMGKMTGNVRMVIYDTESFTNGEALKDPVPVPGAEAKPSEMESDPEQASQAAQSPASVPAVPVAPPSSPIDINAPAAKRPETLPSIQVPGMLLPPLPDGS